MKAWTSTSRLKRISSRTSSARLAFSRRTSKNFFGGTRTPATPELLAQYDLPAADTYDYRAPQTIVNANVEYTVSRKWALFFTAQNLTDAGFSRKLYAPTTPDYARNWLDYYNGVDFTFGIKGQL